MLLVLGVLLGPVAGRAVADGTSWSGTLHVQETQNTRIAADTYGGCSGSSRATVTSEWKIVPRSYSMTEGPSGVLTSTVDLKRVGAPQVQASAAWKCKDDQGCTSSEVVSDPHVTSADPSAQVTLRFYKFHQALEVVPAGGNGLTADMDYRSTAQCPGGKPTSTDGRAQSIEDQAVPRLELHPAEDPSGDFRAPTKARADRVGNLHVTADESLGFRAPQSPTATTYSGSPITTFILYPTVGGGPPGEHTTDHTTFKENVTLDLHWMERRFRLTVNPRPLAGGYIQIQPGGEDANGLPEPAVGTCLVSNAPCVQYYSPGTPVTLQAASAIPFWRFDHWEGDCRGAQAVGGTGFCPVTMDTTRSATGVWVNDPDWWGIKTRVVRMTRGVRQKLKRHGLSGLQGVKERLKSPQPGRLTQTVVMQSAQTATARKSRPVVLARGRCNFPKPGRRTMTLHLTAAGRRLSQTSQTLQLNIITRFARHKGTPIALAQSLTVENP